ncbi:MAG: hypothetical protein H7Y07_13985 [Pyrinomonadaceae bacterium]|nr:hypothetical protein [Sphingobacteriaceae bacterium]
MSVDYCASKEIDYSGDQDILSILKNGSTPKSMYQAAKQIQLKKGVCFLELPVSLNAEAEAFGAQILHDQKGVIIQDYIFENIYDLEKLSPLDVKECSLQTVLECASLAKNDNVILKLMGPFSVLTSLINPMVLFKSMRKNSILIKSALDIILEAQYKYACQAIKNGVKIISYAEPTGFIEMMGTDKFKEFVGFYTIKLMKRLEDKLDGSVFHVCGKSCSALLKCELITKVHHHSEKQTLTDALLDIANKNEIKFTGFKCIQSNTFDYSIWELKLNGGQQYEPTL